MRAREHTDTMLTWWRRVGIDRVDLALRRTSGAMVWHHDLAGDTLPLAWAAPRYARRTVERALQRVGGAANHRGVPKRDNDRILSR